MPSPPLDVSQSFAGRRILFVGATGFVGKVALSMLLRRYPDLGRLFVLVRPGAGSSAEDRFFQKVAGSPVFDPIREVWGKGYDAFLREKVEPLPGDIARPRLNFTDDILDRLGALDVIVNCAGLVSFNPSLETALRINTLGVQNVIEVARRTSAALVHISTCFVAGNRDGEIWEDEPIAGYLPRRLELARAEEEFSVEGEITDCQRLIEQVRELADDRAHVSMFREKGAARLRAEGRDADDERTLKIAMQRERKVWMAERLTELGMERARHWGWPNTYTYTKSLGEQVCAAAEGLRFALVRPAIVESALRYPFPGWNEGFTTTAPLALLGLLGHRSYPAGEKCVLDLIPVDLVAAGLIAATAALLDGRAAPVYQLGSSDTNPLYTTRGVELLGLYKRRYFRERNEGSRWWNLVQSRLEPVPVSRARFDRLSAPLWKSLAGHARETIDQLTPRWGAPRVAALAEHAKEKIEGLGTLTGQTAELFALFMPFIWERRYSFRCDNIRKLMAELTPADRAALRWDPEKIDWRQYWLDVHMRGLEKWVFPALEEEFETKPKAVYTYRDLLEMFDATTKHHRHRTAMWQLPPVKGAGGTAPRRYTYGDLQELAMRAAAILREHGVGPGDHVLLVSENRPEWGIAYFAILKAGAVVVPVDAQSVGEEVRNCIASARAKVAIVSDHQLERLRKEGFDEASLGAERIGFADLFEVEPVVSPGALVHRPRSDDLASLIFTSGTTGKPRGVMLTHKNFSSLIAKLASVFDFDRHDGLLSVLPLHHTFEFTVGLLVPLMRGAQVSYIDELSAEALEVAFAEGNVTGVIGVPALWQLVHRRIVKQLEERGPWVERAFDFLVEWNRKLQEREGPALARLNLGRILFWPVHRKLGGRVRTMISGGSALPVEVLNAFHGMGFHLYEGYGLTEAAPVLTVNRPGTRQVAGSVGEPLPGVDVKIHQPDVDGVGEVVAAGPNIMAGYYENPEASAEVLKDGWLHTGDLGRFDDENRLYIVGRKKEVILGANGENVYPDELEERYRDSSFLKELSVVGLPDESGGEVVACLAVPDYGGNAGCGREEVRECLRQHFRDVSAKLPLAKRVKVLHLADRELPKTATRKVKRKAVVEELKRFERLKQKAKEAARTDRATAAAGPRPDAWLYELLAEVAGKPADRIQAVTRLEELGYDSLLYTELGVALEAAGLAVPEEADLTGVGTAGDFVKLVNSWGCAKARPPAKRRDEAGEIHVPRTVVTLGRAGLAFAQRMTYEKLFSTRVTGRSYVPDNASFLVAANHASHLDMGLVKHALGHWGERLVALAAKDYFFEEPLRRAYFENFTNLVPMERHGSLRESLRLAAEVIEEGYVLLIFPEGTRSATGRMSEFKPSIGYLALTHRIGVLPMYLEGTHQALPKGSLWPRERDIAAHIGPFISPTVLAEAVAKLPRGEQNRAAARVIEDAVRALAPPGSPDGVAPSPGLGP